MNTEKTGNEFGYYAHIYTKADKSNLAVKAPVSMTI